MFIRQTQNHAVMRKSTRSGPFWIIGVKYFENSSLNIRIITINCYFYFPPKSYLQVLNQANFSTRSRFFTPLNRLIYESILHSSNQSIRKRFFRFSDAHIIFKVINWILAIDRQYFAVDRPF